MVQGEGRRGEGRGGSEVSLAPNLIPTALPSHLHLPPPLGQKLSKVAWRAIGNTTEEAGNKHRSAGKVLYSSIYIVDIYMIGMRRRTAPP